MEAAALELYKASFCLGRVIDLVNALVRDGCQGITDEEEASDTICIAGEDVMLALRELAMRLDRAVLSKITGSGS